MNTQDQAQVTEIRTRALTPDELRARGYNHQTHEQFLASQGQSAFGWPMPGDGM